MPLSEELRRNQGRGFASVTEINRQRKQARLERCLKLALGGATSAEIAQALGIAVATVYKYKAGLRAAGRLGCCMQGCGNLRDTSDFTKCRWFVR